MLAVPSLNIDQKDHSNTLLQVGLYKLISIGTDSSWDKSNTPSLDTSEYSPANNSASIIALCCATPEYLLQRCRSMTAGTPRERYVNPTSSSSDTAEWQYHWLARQRSSRALALVNPIHPVSLLLLHLFIDNASPGINYHFARALLAKRCNVILADLALRPEAEELVAEHHSASRAPARAVFQRTDVRRWAQLEEMYRTADEFFGGADVVCPGAGVYEPVRWSNMSVPPPSRAFYGYHIKFVVIVPRLRSKKYQFWDAACNYEREGRTVTTAW